MAAPAPVFRGQANAFFRTDKQDVAYARGQEVPYNVNGAPTGATVAWGDVTGTLSAQADLGAALGAKANLTGGNTVAGSQIFTGQVEYRPPGEGFFGFYPSTSTAAPEFYQANADETNWWDQYRVASWWEIDTDVAVHFTKGLQALNLSGTNTGDQFISTTASRLIGRGSSGAGAAQEIVLGTNLSMSGTTLNATGSGGGYSVVTKTAGYTETTTSGELVIKADLAAGFTIVLPTAVGNSAKFHIKKMQAAGSIIIDGAGTETIDGGLTATLTSQNESLTIVSDNANWLVL